MVIFTVACSDFVNIFDVDWFIKSLSEDVTIVKRVPDKVMRSMEKPPYTMRVPRKSDPEYYLDQVLPVLLRRRVRPFFSVCNWYFYFVHFYIKQILFVNVYPLKMILVW